jgi:predicted transcriptional regulator of viral defense system
MNYSENSKYKVLVLNHLNENGILIFTLDSIKNSFGSKWTSVLRAINALKTEGIIHNIQRGLYALPAFSDQNVLAFQLAPEGGLAYWTAVSFHGLTTQFSNTLYVQSPRAIRSGSVMDVDFRFIKLKPSKATCYDTIGRGNGKFKVTSVEKTILDCLDHPEYSPGWTELIKAISKAKLNSKKLIEAAEAVANISVTKRLGYLLETMNKPDQKSFLKYAQTKVNQKYDLLDSESGDNGPFNSKWRLRLNVPESEIIANLNNLNG